MQKSALSLCTALLIFTSACQTVKRDGRFKNSEESSSKADLGPQMEEGPGTGVATEDFEKLPAWTRINPPQTDVIVQLFNYPFRTITAEMPRLAALGYAQIHVSPPNLTIDSDQWWGRYQPVDYRVIAGPLGNEAEFKTMIKTAHQYKVKIIVDLVLNHTYNTSSPLPKEAAEIVAKEGPLFTEADYHKNECIGNYDDAWEVRNKRLCGGGGDTGLPDLDQSSPNVLKVQQAFIKRLDDMGVDGYRLDAVKHMEADYFGKLLPENVRRGRLIFGEIIADEGTFDRDLEPYLRIDRMSFYDFPLRDTLQKTLGPKGSMRTLADPGLVGSKRALSWDRSVAFIMNHDIPNNEGFRTWILEPKDEELAYAYILGRSEGVPYVYSDLGTKGGAGLKDDRWDHGHRNTRTATMVRFHNYVHGQKQSILWADDCLLAVQRETKGLFAINKCEESRSFPIKDQFAKGSVLTSLDTGKDLPVTGEEISIEVLGRSSLSMVTGAKK